MEIRTVLPSTFQLGRQLKNLSFGYRFDRRLGDHRAVLPLQRHMATHH